MNETASICFCWNVNGVEDERFDEEKNIRFERIIIIDIDCSSCYRFHTALTRDKRNCRRFDAEELGEEQIIKMLNANKELSVERIYGHRSSSAQHEPESYYPNFIPIHAEYA